MGAPPAAHWLGTIADLLPTVGRALDVAGGSGRNALWLARRGLHVTIVDISSVGLGLARREASEHGLSVETLACDLEVDPLPQGPWDLVLSVNYLQTRLIPVMVDRLAPGGRLAFRHPTRRNLTRHPKPPARFLLEEGQLASLIAGLPLEMLHAREGWSDEGYHVSELVAERRPATA